MRGQPDIAPKALVALSCDGPRLHCFMRDGEALAAMSADREDEGEDHGG